MIDFFCFCSNFWNPLGRMRAELSFGNSIMTWSFWRDILLGECCLFHCLGIYYALPIIVSFFRSRSRFLIKVRERSIIFQYDRVDFVSNWKVQWKRQFEMLCVAKEWKYKQNKKKVWMALVVQFEVSSQVKNWFTRQRFVDTILSTLYYVFKMVA